MTWNYRLRRESDDYITIVEAYYDSDGKRTAMSKEAVTVGGASVAEILRVLAMMKRDVLRSHLDIIHDDKKKKKP